jgi:hypothetical protein
MVPNFWRLYPRVMDEELPEERRLRGLEKLAESMRRRGDEAGTRRLMDEYWARDAHYKTWATVTEGATVALRADGESIRNCRIERVGGGGGAGWTGQGVAWQSTPTEDDFARGGNVDIFTPLGKALRGQEGSMTEAGSRPARSASVAGTGGAYTL